jgi:hypothetical protein
MAQPGQITMVPLCSQEKYSVRVGPGQLSRIDSHQIRIPWRVF